jgi:hypothetical protein
MVFYALSVDTSSPAEWQTNVQSQEPDFLIPSDYEVAIGRIFCVALLSSVLIVLGVVVVVAVVTISCSRTVAFAVTRIATAGAMASTRHVLKW